MIKIQTEFQVTEGNFDEARYLAANFDVAAAVKSGALSDGRAHFEYFGDVEKRQVGNVEVEEMRLARSSKLESVLDLDMPFKRIGMKYDFLTDELREMTGISDTNAVSSNFYDGYVEDIIRSCEGGIVLDCGAGKRPEYYDNVINFEIVNYFSTDVIGVGERLPFKDNSFDAVISIAVLEHVRDPQTCSREIARVLKPGGKLFCAVPFLQPEHGYPHHYYNMAPQGLRALFDRTLEIDAHRVYGSVLPVSALRWIATSWAEGLSGATRDAFLDLPLRSFVEPAELEDILRQDWVTGLSEQKNFELACATVLFAHKPDEIG